MTAEDDLRASRRRRDEDDVAIGNTAGDRGDSGAVYLGKVAEQTLPTVAPCVVDTLPVISIGVGSTPIAPVWQTDVKIPVVCLNVVPAVDEVLIARRPGNCQAIWCSDEGPPGSEECCVIEVSLSCSGITIPGTYAVFDSKDGTCSGTLLHSGTLGEWICFDDRVTRTYDVAVVPTDTTAYCGRCTQILVTESCPTPQAFALATSRRNIKFPVKVLHCGLPTPGAHVTVSGSIGTLSGDTDANGCVTIEFTDACAGVPGDTITITAEPPAGWCCWLESSVTITLTCEEYQSVISDHEILTGARYSCGGHHATGVDLAANPACTICCDLCEFGFPRTGLYSDGDGTAYLTYGAFVANPCISVDCICYWAGHYTKTCDNVLTQGDPCCIRTTASVRVYIIVCAYLDGGALKFRAYKAQPFGMANITAFPCTQIRGFMPGDWWDYLEVPYLSCHVDGGGFLGYYQQAGDATVTCDESGAVSASGSYGGGSWVDGNCGPVADPGLIPCLSEEAGWTFVGDPCA